MSFVEEGHAQPVDLGTTLDLHYRIRGDLDLREAATTEKEAKARRAFEEALQDIAAERHAIKQYRELLARAENLYHSFVDGTSATTPDHDVTTSMAVETVGEGWSPPAEREVSSVDGTDTSIGEKNSSELDNLRTTLSKEVEPGQTGGHSWWASFWRSGARDSEENISWDKALTPVDGAERAVWDERKVDQLQE